MQEEDAQRQRGRGCGAARRNGLLRLWNNFRFLVHPRSVSGGFCVGSAGTRVCLLTPQVLQLIGSASKLQRSSDFDWRRIVQRDTSAGELLR